MKIAFRELGNDLFCDIGECSCPSPLFVGSSVEHLMKKKHKITGYGDDYFFDTVNKEPKKKICDGCGKAWEYQWFRDGVEVKEATL